MNRYAMALDWCDRLADRERARRHQGAQLAAVQFGGQPARKVAVDAVRVGERLDTVGGSRRGRMCA